MQDSLAQVQFMDLYLIHSATQTKKLHESALYNFIHLSFDFVHVSGKKKKKKIIQGFFFKSRFSLRGPLSTRDGIDHSTTRRIKIVLEETKLTIKTI